ncbi:phage tail fiber protein [Halomonas sp. hl-4]|uniref:phage tail fiber protein n=1 Tax=Halomonas sp. hl-4 TaxID=1761789 RepID=UPI000BBF4F08|nr:hypothetical protein [Halomonas sp. hl-4]SNY95570.1 hypothetical protein SAMN04488142_0071 [Halomonas sp. hl-4]
MGAMSNYLEQRMINATLRGDNFTAPAVADLYLALFTSDPTDENTTANEVGETWYSRKQTGNWSSPSVDGEGRTRTDNSSSITFDAVQDDDSAHTITITHIGIYDSDSAGNLLYHEALTTPKTLEVGDVISFAAGALILRLD